MNIKKFRNLSLLALTALGLAACQPKSASQKVEDKAEDAGHEMKQGMERAKENVHDATR